MDPKEEEQQKQKPLDLRPRDYSQAPPISNNLRERASDPQKGWSGDSWAGSRWSGRNFGGRER